MSHLDVISALPILVASIISSALPAGAYPDPEHKCEVPRALYKEVLKRVDGGRVFGYDEKHVFATYFDIGLAANAARVYGQVDGEILSGMDGSDSWLVDALTYRPSKELGDMTCDVTIDYHGAMNGKQKAEVRFIQKPEAGKMKIYNILYGHRKDNGLRDLMR